MHLRGITVRQGETLTADRTLFTPSGIHAIASGATVTAEVRQDENLSAAKVATLTASALTTAAEAPNVRLELAATLTAALEPGEYFYGVKVDNAGVIYKSPAGSFIVKGAVAE